MYISPARCDILASLALKDALCAEMREQRDQSEGWKLWAQQASLASASMARRFCEAPLSLTKEDHVGSKLIRPELLDQQVSF